MIFTYILSIPEKNIKYHIDNRWPAAHSLRQIAEIFDIPPAGFFYP